MVNLALWASQQAGELGKALSPWMLKQLLKSAGFTWRRVPKSSRPRRDEAMFDFFRAELKHLLADAGKGLARLWFYDESGFNLNPNAVYAWLPPKKGAAGAEQAVLPAQRGNVLTLAGFLSSDNELEAYSQKGAMDSLAFEAFVEDFIGQQQTEKSKVRHIVVIDNASFHKSARIRRKMEEWKKKNLFFQFLPPYCSELNRIEILWRRIKHEWLEIHHYLSPQKLEDAVNNIVQNFGTKYTITFC